MTSPLPQKQKVVVRRLPPNLPQDVFLESISKWHEKYKFFSYEEGKLAKSAAKESLHSRAYLVFIDTPTLLDFHKCYNGHKFIDSKGNTYSAQVEFAPFQRWIDPSKKKRQDNRMGTIATDPDYIEFCESLTKSPSKEEFEGSKTDLGTDFEYLLSKKEHQPKSTPLLDALKLERERKAAKKLKKRAKEASSVRTKSTSKGTSSSQGRSVLPGKSNSIGDQNGNGSKPLESSSQKKRNWKKKNAEKNFADVSNEVQVSKVMNSDENLVASEKKPSSKPKFTLIKKKDQEAI